MTDICGILGTDMFPHKDKNGCIKPHGHNDAHIFKDQHGDYIQWEDDYSCTCGCWDNYETSGATSCGRYEKLINFAPSFVNVRETNN